jgi:hypothetical protein
MLLLRCIGYVRLSKNRKAAFAPLLCIWFAALGDYQTNPSILHLMARLLEGSPEVLELMPRNPFPNAPPNYLRAMLYEYHFTTSAERHETGKMVEA